MAAEPYVDITDPAYWQEIADIDLKDANNLSHRGNYYLSGLKCYQAIEKCLSGYFVRNHFANTLPTIKTLCAFAIEIGVFKRLTAEQQQLLRDLQPYQGAAKSLPAKQALAAANDEDSSLALNARTTALAASIYQLR
jgi:hypothetical protein